MLTKVFLKFADYINHGCEKAVIELELYNPNGSNYVISRHITSNSSSWFLQGKSTTLKKVVYRNI